MGYQRFCGQLTVPVNRAVTGGPTISINVALVPALISPSAAEPLFALEGGPGGAGTRDMTWLPTVFSAVHAARDIVLIDQRGTGASNELTLPPPPDTSDLSTQQADDQIAQWANDFLGSIDVDPTAFTSTLAADDIDDVRAALGYDQIALFGPSYGGTLAQYYVRQHPEHVARIVLDGATPLDVPIFERMAANSQTALDLLLDRCTNDAGCHAAFPAIKSEWQSLRALLQHPTDTGLIDPQTGEQLIVTMADLAPGIHDALVNQNSAASLPFLIHLVYQGEWQQLAAEMGGGAAGNVSEPLMKREILCSEAWARFDPAAVAEAGQGSFAVDARVAEAQAVEQVCKPFPPGIVPANDGAPMSTTAPILWLAGDGDPQDPPANLADVADQNPNATIVVVPVQNHTVGHLGCLPDVIEAFLASPTGDIDTSCINLMPPVPAFRVR